MELFATKTRSNATCKLHRTKDWISIRVALATILLLASQYFSFAQETKRIYFIGNSVTDAINYNGLKALAESRSNTHIWGRNMIPGAPLSWIWQHPNDGISEPPYGVFGNALANYTWDYLSLQPYDRGMDGTEGDRPMSANFINTAKAKSPNLRVLVYNRWPRTPGGVQPNNPSLTADSWNAIYLGTNDIETRKYFEDLAYNIRTDFPNMPKALLCPVGEVFYNLNNKMKAGQIPGYSSIWQVYTDGIHLLQSGSYIAACTFYTTMYQIDPRGLGVPSEFGTLSASFVSAVQQTIWETVTTYKDNQGNTWSGVATTDIPVTAISVSPSTLSLSAGQTATITPTILPANATNKTITWSSSNNGIASVNSAGVVSAVSAGTATITATTNSGSKTATISVSITGSTFRNPENPAGAVSGLSYYIYNGTWDVLPDFNALTPASSGTGSSFDISSKAGTDGFGFKFSGYVNVPVDGNYTFYTSSDDGSKLLIGTTMVVNNDGVHATQESSGTIGLKAGKHAITVLYFDKTGGDQLSVSYSGTGISKTAIPASALFRLQANQAPIAVLNATPISGNAPLTVSFSATGSSDPDNGDIILGYEYNFGDGSVTSTSNAPSHIYTTPGVYTASLKVMDNNNLYGAAVTKTITVLAGNSSTTIPAKIEAEAYSAMSGVQTETTTDTGGGSNVGWIDANDWFEYTINVPSNGTYQLDLRVGSIATSSVQILDGTTLLGTLAIPNTGGWQTWQTISSQNFNLLAGTKTIRLTAIAGNWNVNWIQFKAVSNGTATSIPAKIQAENYSAMSGVLQETTTDSGGGSNVGWIETNDWMEYSIHAPTAGLYKLDLRIATTAAASVQILRGTTVLTTVSIPNTGGWQTWQTITSQNFNLPEGSSTIRLVAAIGGWNINWLEFKSVTGDTQAPSQPTGLVASSVSQTSFSLNWSASTDNVGVTSYEVFAGSTSKGTTSSTSLSVSGLVAGTAYIITVIAKDAAGNVSLASPSISVTTATGPTPSGSMTLGTNFWNKGWGTGEVEYFQSNINWSTTTNPWRPDFLSELSIYKCLRFMDWVPTNNSNVTSWSQRVQKSANQTQSAGVAYEWQIDLCNRMNADMWVTIPAKANADYSYQLANLLNSQLNPNLKIYIEYSNECWNGQFEQTQYCIDQGVALNLPGGNQYYKGWSYVTYASVRVFEQFERVFGKNSARLVKVIAGQSGYVGGNNTAPVCEQQLAVLSNPVVNPNNTTINSYAVAPYFGGESFSDFTASIPSSAQHCQNHLNSIAASGLSINLIAYEGGQHCQVNAAVINRDPAMYQMYINYLNAMKDKIGGMFCHYTHLGAFNDGNAWGAKEYTGQALSSAHKYRALTNWVAANSSGERISATARPTMKHGAETSQESLYLSPNPAHENFNVTLNGPSTVQLVNMQGKVLLAKTSQGKAIQFDVSRLSPGIYLVKIQSKSGVETKKLIIE